jgi:hypothetical protein
MVDRFDRCELVTARIQTNKDRFSKFLMSPTEARCNTTDYGYSIVKNIFIPLVLSLNPSCCSLVLLMFEAVLASIRTLEQPKVFLP